MLYEIVSLVLILDSVIAIVIAFTPVGDASIEKHYLVKRYMPLTKGWALLYFLLTIYIGYLTFAMM